MRNLKKVLSMALAIVMMLGMMTFASAADEKKTEAPKKVTTAADLSDMDKVVSKEAVSLLVDLKVVEGTDKGTFDPTGDVTRAVMAKLIYVAKMGVDDKAANFVGAATDLTDVKGHWAEGYINYCYSTGIVAGRGEGKFDPDAKVQAVEAAKMILVALGYDAEAQGYTDPKLWSVSIMQDAKKASLMTDVKEASNVALTRDSAAQMIFNGLFAKTITCERSKDFQGKWYVSKVTENATTLGEEVYGLVKVTGTVNSVTGGKAGLTDVKPAGLQTNVNNKVAVSSDMMGKKAVIYVKAAVDKFGVYTFDKIYSSVASTGASVVLGTSMDGTPIIGANSGDKDLTTNRPSNKGFKAELYKNAADKYVVKCYINGADPAADDANKNDIPDAVEADAKLSGVIVELIDSNSDNLADIIKITKKAVKTVTSDVKTKTVDDVLQVAVAGVFSGYVDAKNVPGYADLKKDDVVLSYKSGDNYIIEKAAVVEGAIAATKSAGDSLEVKVDGTFYGKSGLVLGTTPLYDMKAGDDVYKFYLDNNKNVIKTEKVSTSTTSERAVVLSTGWVGSTTEIGGKSYAQVELLFTDGTSEVVTLAKYAGLKLKFAPGSTATEIGYEDVKTAAAGKFVTYTINSDDKYELKLAADPSTIAANSNILNGKKVFTSTGNGVADDSTVFLVASMDGSKTVYKMYTGISAVPAMKTVKGTFLTKDGIATFAYIDATGGTVEGIDGTAVYAYVPKTSDVVAYPKYNEYVAYVDGVKTTINVVGTLATNNAIYKLSTKNDAGNYTGATVEATPFVVGYPTAKNGTLRVDSSTTTGALYTYDKDTMIYFINAKLELTVLTMDELKPDLTNKIMVLGSNNLADIIFIMEVPGTVATATMTYSVNGVGSIAIADKENIPSLKVGDKVAITVTVAANSEATYTIDKPTVVVDATNPSTITIEVTAENGVAKNTYTVIVDKAA